jgi:two-component system sensor histidine kinase AtoS
MVAGVAHEVRQPLSALTTITFVLTDKLRERADLGREVTLLDHEVKRMAAMMDELLDFAQPAKLLVAPTAIVALFADAVETFRAESHRETPTVASTAGPGLDAVILDRGRMVQVLVNLLQNARRHAAGITRIELRAHRVADDVVLVVENDGAGIDAALLPNIFEPFTTGGRGTGLGLAIARKLVELHGGTIVVATGDTTRFTIRLPADGV